MGLARIFSGGLLVEETLRLQPVYGLGDGRRPHTDALGQLPGRLAILRIERKHDLVLPGIEAMLQQARSERRAGQPRRRMQPAHDSASGRLGHDSLSGG